MADSDRDPYDFDVHSHGVYRPDYDDDWTVAIAVILMGMCTLFGFAVGLLTGLML